MKILPRKMSTVSIRENFPPRKNPLYGIEICDWILVETFHMGILGFNSKDKNSKKLKCISQVTRDLVVLWYND